MKFIVSVALCLLLSLHSTQAWTWNYTTGFESPDSWLGIDQQNGVVNDFVAVTERAAMRGSLGLEINMTYVLSPHQDDERTVEFDDKDILNTGLSPSEPGSYRNFRKSFLIDWELDYPLDISKNIEFEFHKQHVKYDGLNFLSMALRSPIGETDFTQLVTTYPTGKTSGFTLYVDVAHGDFIQAVHRWANCVGVNSSKTGTTATSASANRPPWGSWSALLPPKIGSLYHSVNDLDGVIFIDEFSWEEVDAASLGSTCLDGFVDPPAQGSPDLKPFVVSPPALGKYELVFSQTHGRLYTRDVDTGDIQHWFADTTV